MARVVAELGRPETPDETAARKAASSQAYRSSKTFRNLLVALGVILAVVAVVIFGVPRGEIPDPPPIDVTAEAAALSETLQRPVLDPDLPDDWRVNAASLEGGSVDAWTVVAVPSGTAGFLRVSQGFDADESWPLELLAGTRPDGTVTIAGIVWEEYHVSDPSRAGNVSYALGTEAGADRILVYGSSSPETAAALAEELAPQITELRAAP
ncbi:DUF4245 family protein [Microbacterium lushaniae]|uniref:DUF4245 family protein n=1 Tax=Microbacterium lushaniae TaxID=2614639 RepID=A0A5J6L591_9MICO|nr:DUF4245 family protein [Microbacterium lushaniae]QEW03637.1 DUF4245 family protein [Microbacterium lushaniae]